MKKQRAAFAIVAFLALLTMSSPDQAQAYIGPGAGFAFLSSFLALFVAFALALFYLLSWPLRFALKAMLRKGPRTTTKSAVDRVIVIGLDGMDPKLVDKFLAKGKLPNFRKLQAQGAFAPLATSYPSISPAAWSSFMTGVEALKSELIKKLTNLKDEAEHTTAIREVVDTAGMLPGPYLDDAPDLLLGYNAGYRNSWDCAAGRVTEQVFEDNTKSWSDDHCVDPPLVPGVLFCNRKITTHQPDIKDIAPTVLQLFGVAIPPYMKGQPLLEEQDGRGPTQPEVKTKWESLGQKEQAA